MSEKQIYNYMRRIANSDVNRDFFIQVIVPSLKARTRSINTIDENNDNLARDQTLRYYCSVCNLKNNNDKDKDEVSKDGRKLVVVNRERVSFLSFYSYIRHLNEQHKDKLPCCGKVFDSDYDPNAPSSNINTQSKEVAAAAAAKNQKEKNYTCHVCDVSFLRKHHYETHLKSQKHLSKKKSQNMFQSKKKQQQQQQPHQKIDVNDDFNDDVNESFDDVEQVNISTSSSSSGSSSSNSDDCILAYTGYFSNQNRIEKAEKSKIQYTKVCELEESLSIPNKTNKMKNLNEIDSIESIEKIKNNEMITLEDALVIINDSYYTEVILESSSSHIVNNENPFVSIEQESFEQTSQQTSQPLNIGIIKRRLNDDDEDQDQEDVVLNDFMDYFEGKFKKTR